MTMSPLAICTRRTQTAACATMSCARPMRLAGIQNDGFTWHELIGRHDMNAPLASDEVRATRERNASEQ